MSFIPDLGIFTFIILCFLHQNIVIIQYMPFIRRKIWMFKIIRNILATYQIKRSLLNPIFSHSKKLFLLLLIIIVDQSADINAQIRTELNDGPYIFQVQDTLRIQWIEAGVGKDTVISCNEATMFDRPNLPKIDLRDLDFVIKNKSVHTDIDKIAAISDVHGQYDLMIQLLKAHKIIDEDLQWIYGEGHLVIVGDNMDRGGKVMDILWFLFQLEKQARKSNGMVHVLLGNHEMMVLNGDLRYLNKKYYYTSAVFKTRYDQFFKEGSILGDWIANQQVITSLNQVLFLHGGMSPKVLDLKLSLDQINRTFSGDLIRQSVDDIDGDKKKSTLFFESGPLWYRGYFDKESLSQKDLDKSLKQLDAKKIVVGHTSLNTITPLYGGKVIGIDCSIKLGLDAQLLLIEKGRPFVGDLSGNRKLLESSDEENPKSLFSYIQNLESTPIIEISTNLDALVNNDVEEIYQGASFTVKTAGDEELAEINGEIRTRGRTRKMFCQYPPAKLNFSRSSLNSLGFLGLDKLKLVLPCSDDSSSYENLYKEYLLYDIYQSLIDSDALQTVLANFKFKAFEDNQRNTSMPGFLVEDDTEFIDRNGGKLIEMGTLTAIDFDRTSFLRMCLFQYMIANTDWAIENRNNILTVQHAQVDLYSAVPYDFDFAGFVNQPYATPDDSLPIKSIHDRHFMGYSMSESEFDEVVQFFLSIEKDVYHKCDQATYLSTFQREKSKLYLKFFFNELRERSSLLKKVVK